MKVGKKAISFFILLCTIICMAYSFECNAEGEKEANSWRYKEGKPIQGKEKRSITERRSDAWSEQNGSFVNDRGEVIKGAVKKGIDVSEWQGDIDWNSVKNSDVDFAIVRCGYAGNYSKYDDFKWKQNADACTRLGIPFGTYLYSYATSVEDARSEAEHVLRLVEGYDLSYPIYYDMEDSSTVGVGKQKLAEIAKTFCDIISAHGYEVGVYANKYWWTTYLTDPVFEQWEHWVAQYNSVCTYNGDYRIWQCASDGKVPGINGNVDINFEFGRWKINKISTDVVSPQPMEKDIMLSADMRGNTSGLQYKFVWQKNNWQEWGVIKEFNENDSTIWHPDSAGDYKIYMDVKDQSGYQETVTCSYKIKNWSHDGVSTSVDSPQLKNKNITIKAGAGGETSQLQYKFVWMKDDWEKWGVLQGFSANSTAEWTPKESGQYYIYVDIQDEEKVQDTKIIEFEVLDKPWGTDENSLVFEGNPEVGLETNIKANFLTLIPGENLGELEYKFVWMKDNWKEWGVLQEFSGENQAKWTPISAGTYYLYVDVKDAEGNQETRRLEVEVKLPQWTYEGINVSLPSPQVTNKMISISPRISGNTYGLQYKYVWMKDNWKEWGVIQEFSQKTEVEFQPKSSGKYTFYIDVKAIDGIKTTQTIPFEFLDKNWLYEKVAFESSGDYVLGETIRIIPEVKCLVENTNLDNLEYKYVWMKNNWEKWGVIQDFSNQSSFQWNPEEYGTYWIYVDVKDGSETMVTQRALVQIEQGEWKLQDIVLNVDEKHINIIPQVAGCTYGLEYKYVWMRNNWEEWGVIQDFTEKSSIDWTIEKTGEVKIYVDVRDKTGKMVSISRGITIE